MSKPVHKPWKPATIVEASEVLTDCAGRCLDAIHEGAISDRAINGIFGGGKESLSGREVRLMHLGMSLQANIRTLDPGTESISDTLSFFEAVVTAKRRLMAKNDKNFDDVSAMIPRLQGVRGSMNELMAEWNGSAGEVYARRRYGQLQIGQVATAAESAFSVKYDHANELGDNPGSTSHRMAFWLMGATAVPVSLSVLWQVQIEDELARFRLQTLSSGTTDVGGSYSKYLANRIDVYSLPGIRTLRDSTDAIVFGDERAKEVCLAAGPISVAIGDSMRLSTPADTVPFFKRVAELSYADRVEIIKKAQLLFPKEGGRGDINEQGKDWLRSLGIIG